MFLPCCPKNYFCSFYGISQAAYVMTGSAQIPPVSDEEVVRRFRETGDNAWFAEIFARHGRKVYFACRGFSWDAAAAEDATQETFLRAYEKLNQFSGGDLCGWLMRIAKNICIDHWRKRRPEAGDEAAMIEDSAENA